MKKLYAIPGIILSLIFVVTTFQFVQHSERISHEFVKEKEKISEVLNFNDRLLSARDWLLPKKAWEERKMEVDQIIIVADKKYNEAQQYGYYILFASLIYLCLMLIIYAKSRIFYGLTMAISSISMMLLLQGISNPILEMGAFKQEMKVQFYAKPNDIPGYNDAITKVDDIKEYTAYARVVPTAGEYVADKIDGYVDYVTNFMTEQGKIEYGMDRVFHGRTYFYYQNKGIMDVIHLLWDHGNKPVAAAIGTFSIIIPCIKLLLTFILLLLPIKGMKLLRKILGYISKWSMADVFVVGAFLAYLSFSNMSPGVDMESNVLYGLYYFGGYVLLSISLSFLLDASIREKLKLKEGTTTKSQSENDESAEIEKGNSITGE